MHRLEKLCNQIRKTNSVMISYPTLSRRLCTEKSKDQGVNDSLEKSEEQNSYVDVTEEVLGNENKLGGFAKSVEKYKSLTEEEVVKPQSFVTLLRNSKFIDVRQIF